MEVDSLESGSKASASAPARVSKLSRLRQKVSALAEQMKEMLAFQRTAQTQPRPKVGPKTSNGQKMGNPSASSPTRLAISAMIVITERNRNLETRVTRANLKLQKTNQGVGCTGTPLHG